MQTIIDGDQPLSPSVVAPDESSCLPGYECYLTKIDYKSDVLLLRPLRYQTSSKIGVVHRKDKGQPCASRKPIAWGLIIST